jgi:hypothetical protein
MFKRLRQAAGTRHRLVVSLPLSTMAALAPMLICFAIPYILDNWSDSAVFALCLVLGVVLGLIFSFAASLGALIAFALLAAYSTTLPSRGDAGMGIFFFAFCIANFLLASLAVAILRTIALLFVGARPE